MKVCYSMEDFQNELKDLKPGKIITVDESGWPELNPPLPPTVDDIYFDTVQMLPGAFSLDKIIGIAIGIMIGEKLTVDVEVTETTIVPFKDDGKSRQDQFIRIKQINDGYLKRRCHKAAIDRKRGKWN